MRNIYYYVCFFSFLTIISTTEIDNSSCLERQKALATLETAEILLSKAENSFPSCREDNSSVDESGCGKNKSLAYIEVSKKLISDLRKNFPKCPKVIDDPSDIDDPNDIDQDDKPKPILKHNDCSEILANGRNESGVYTVWPRENSTTGKPLDVYCDMETDGGGWMVIQRRGKFPVQEDFQQNWENYKNGFGNITQEFWLGNENIRILCHKGCQIRFDLQDENRLRTFALYQIFYLTSLASNYTIHISDYSGTAGDSMKHQNNFGFSTHDKGNTKRAKEHAGGWWYDDSMINNNLNGLYRPGEGNSKNVIWYQWRNFRNLASVEIKVRPKKTK